MQLPCRLPRVLHILFAACGSRSFLVAVFGFRRARKILNRFSVRPLAVLSLNTALFTTSMNFLLQNSGTCKVSAASPIDASRLPSAMNVDFPLTRKASPPPQHRSSHQHGVPPLTHQFCYRVTTLPGNKELSLHFRQSNLPCRNDCGHLLRTYDFVIFITTPL